MNRGFALSVATVFVLCLCSLVEASEQKSGKINFEPLPEGEGYRLDEWTASWGLSGLVDVSSGVALLIKPNPPYDIISNVFRAALGKSHTSVTIKQVVDYEIPLIVLAALSLVCAFIIPIVGLIFCCCRCTGHCGGDFQAKMVRQPTKARCCYVVGLLICSIFLILGSSFILASSVKMHDSLEDTRVVWRNTFQDAITYKNNTFKEATHILGSEVNSGLEVILQDVVNLALGVAMPVIDEGTPLVNNLVASIITLAQESISLVEQMKQITKAGEALHDISTELQEALQLINQDISEAKADCGGGPSCSGISSVDITPEADFSKVPNITNTTRNLENVNPTNLSQEAVKGNDTFHNMTGSIGKLTTGLDQDFQNYSTKVKDVYPDVLQPLEDKADEFITDTVIPIRDDIDSKYLGDEGLLPKYDKYRHIFYLLVGCLVLLDACLILVGVALGVAGSYRFDTPGTRTRTADLGGRILMGSAGLFFFSIFFINLSAGVFFLLGSNIAVVCEDVSSLELWRKTLDDPQVMGEYPLSKLLYNDGSVKLQLSQILSECGDDKAPWDVFRMNHLFNLSSILNYRDEIPQLDRVFAELNSTIKDTVVVSDSAKQSVDDASAAGVQDVNYTQYYEQTDKPILNGSLENLAGDFEGAANAANNLSVKQKLRAVAANLTALHQNEVLPAEQKSSGLGQAVGQMEKSAATIVTSVNSIRSGMDDLSTFLTGRALGLAAQGVVTHGGELFDTVDHFLWHVTGQVENDVGRCRVISNIYNSVTGSVCQEYGGGLNASWIGFGISSVALVVAIILCVRASKLFRRVPGEALDDVSGGVHMEGELLQLPWMDDLSMGGVSNANLVVKSVEDVKI